MNTQIENTIENALSTVGGHEGEKRSGEDGEKSSTDATLEQLRAENEQLKATIRMAAAHREITGELKRAGARSPELLFEIVKGELQFGEDGAARNAAALIERLKRKFPEQFAVTKPPPSIDAGAGVVEVPQLTKEALARMKPVEIAALDWEDVKKVLAT